MIHLQDTVIRELVDNLYMKMENKCENLEENAQTGNRDKLSHVKARVVRCHDRELKLG